MQRASHSRHRVTALAEFCGGVGFLFSQTEPRRNTENGARGCEEAPGDEVGLDATVHAADGFVAVSSAQAQSQPVVGNLEDGELVDVVGGWRLLRSDQGELLEGFGLAGRVVIGDGPLIELCGHGVVRSGW